MLRNVLVLAVLAACGKGGGAGGTPDGPAIPTRTRSLPASAVGHQLTGTLPDWKQGQNAAGHGDRELYVDGPSGTLARVEVGLWDEAASSGDPLAEAKEQAQHALHGRLDPQLTGGKTLTDANKPFLVQEPAELSKGVYAFALGWRDSTQADAQVGVAAKIWVTQPDTSDAAHPLRGFTCSISAVHASPKDPSYLDAWKALAAMCGDLKLSKGGT